MASVLTKLLIPLFFFLPAILLGESLSTLPSTVIISISEVQVGQEVTFTYDREQSCGPTSKVYPEGTSTAQGTVEATFNSLPLTGNLQDGISKWTHTYSAPGDYYVWFECGAPIGMLQASTKAGKSLPVMIVPALNGLAGAGVNFNRIHVLPASNIPTLSEWGIIILALLFLSVGAVQAKSIVQINDHSKGS